MKANSALTVSNSLVFALSLFTVKVPAAISSSPSPCWLMMYIQQPHPPSEGEGLALFLRPQACSISVCLLFIFVMYWKIGMAITGAVHVYTVGVCMWMSASMFMWENRVRFAINICGADIQSTCFAFPPEPSKAPFQAAVHDRSL